MFKHYRDYYWKAGKPQGIDPLDPTSNESSYKIIIDPYFKRYTVEKYCYEKFETIVYDSSLLDFRRLNPMDQMAWSRELISEEKNKTRALLRNHEDRIILFEDMTFQNGYCTSCVLSSCHGIPVATHTMYYTKLMAAFNGVILQDLEGRYVIKKTYDVDELTGEFTTLLSEELEFPPISKERIDA